MRIKDDYPIDRFLDLALALTTERQLDVLFDMILTESMDLTRCDGGTVYVKSGEQLEFESLYTRSKGVHMSRLDGDVSLPPVQLNRSSVCACAAIDKKLINLPDIYDSKEYDFSGAKKYDSLNDYRTRSMLVVPMIDDNRNVIGVLQLINAADENGDVIPFDKGYERMISAMTSLASVSLHNRMLAKEVLDILHSFVRVMIGAVDTRSPYNANHTKSMVSYGEKFLKYAAEKEPDLFPENEWDPLLMSIWLHDLGKLVIPLEVMDKESRLGDALPDVMHRIEVAILCEKIRGLSGEEGTDEAIGRLNDARDFILDINKAGFLPDEKLERVRQIAAIQCLTSEGDTVPLLTDDEVVSLSVRKGTLTDEERHIIETHVEYTESMLSEMVFKGLYERVPEWASGHHEFINGTGYPHKKKGDEIPKETRLITILDIYDALTAEDRPYKPPMPTEKAFAILRDMESEGKLDKKLLDMFYESGAWRRD
ncbi:MAG: GAF domain-containing protein [Lachnospiraceae bacterium]|nr:GAF domain-containing protein [Lachnospiraceae bacterium]